MIKNFDLTNFIKFSSRANSESYISKDKSLMVKFVVTEDSHDISDIKTEYYNSQIVYKLNIPTAKVIDMVETNDHKIGILSEFIENKKSLSTAVRENNDFAREAGIKMSKMAKIIHNTKCDTSSLSNIKDNIKEACNEFVDDDALKEKILNKISIIPDADTCIHGDLNFSNVITTGERDYLIDLGLFCYGNPIFDLGIYTVFCGKFVEPSLAEAFFKLKLDTIKEMNEAFMLDYFGKSNIKELESTINELYLIGCIGLLYHAKHIQFARNDLPNIINSIKDGI